MAAAPRCADCDVAMEEGFIPDGVLLGATVSHWHRGSPVKAKFAEIESGVRLTGTRMMPIHAFRCPKCGLLRAYAHPKVWRKVD